VKTVLEEERLPQFLIEDLLAFLALLDGSLIPHGNKEALFPMRIQFFDPKFGNKEHQDCVENALRSPSLFPRGIKEHHSASC
jgi:hypothetical protein